MTPTLDIRRSTSGWSVAANDGSFVIEAARVRAVVRIAGYAHHWSPTRFTQHGDQLRASDGPAGLALEWTVSRNGDDAIVVSGHLINQGHAETVVERFELLRAEPVRLGGDARGWRIFRNGYQSWSGTYTLGAAQADRDFPLRFARVGVTDARHRAPHVPGRVRSDALSAIVDTAHGAAVGIAFTSLDVAFGFVEVEIASTQPRLVCWADFDGMRLSPGASTPAVELVLAVAAGGWQALRRVAEHSGMAMGARGTTIDAPTGWCSWYYYFEKVTERDIDVNLDVLARDGRGGPSFGCDYVMVDDGHQSRIGDWLETAPHKFPSGMRAVAERIHAAGFDAGIWWAPFLVAANSRIAGDHPEWLVRHPHGRPITGLINPAWGITTPMRVLDTTHPEVLAHLEDVARHIGHDWGYEIQKLDFLYAAALPGRRHDMQATRAQALRRGLEAIRRGAGAASFLLGCGCPLGPAVGVVDAMRIGADVTPHWTDWIARRILLDVHGLATRHALINTLTRAVLDRAWWRNDPDCLMVRDRDTKLTEEEVLTMATVFAMTDGMLVLSDRLDRLPPPRLRLLRQARHLARGRVEVCDLFDDVLPGRIVSRHPERLDVAVINLSDAPQAMTFDLRRIGVQPEDGRHAEYWTGSPIEIREGQAHFGTLPAHAARVLSLSRRSGPVEPHDGSPRPH